MRVLNASLWPAFPHQLVFVGGPTESRLYSRSMCCDFEMCRIFRQFGLICVLNCYPVIFQRSGTIFHGTYFLDPRFPNFYFIVNLENFHNFFTGGSCALIKEPPLLAALLSLDNGEFESCQLCGHERGLLDELVQPVVTVCSV